MYLDSESLATTLRTKAVDIARRRILLTKFSGSDQESDISEPLNCEGFGRLRHFRRAVSEGWPSNPLPIDPARHALGLSPADDILAQAFQIAVCDWRCWYCFVPFNLLSANSAHSGWVSPEALIEWYAEDVSRAPMIDLTGGQPDLVPEWTLWVTDELVKRGLGESTFVWADDNLSSDYFWRYLSREAIERICAYPRYARVGCFKGFGAESFAFNTTARPEFYDRQFEIFARHVALGVECYAYVTLTAPDDRNIRLEMPKFVDRLQRIAHNLPLRTIPLEIVEWGPVTARLNEEREAAMQVQKQAVEAWREEIARRFTSEETALPIYAVPLQ